jgi:hypothetical protein
MPSVAIAGVVWLNLPMEEQTNTNIVVWNTRGLNDPARRTAVRIAV